MTTTALSAAKVNARENARAGNGEFGFHERAENPDIQLSADRPTSSVQGIDIYSDAELEVIGNWVNRLEDQGIIAHFQALEINGDNLSGIMTPEDTHIELGFDFSSQRVDFWRANAAGLDENHAESSTVGASNRLGAITDQDIKASYTSAMECARGADAWAAASPIRSGRNIRFELPEIVTNSKGDVARTSIKTPAGSYVVDVSRGSREIEIRNDSDWTVVSPRVRDAVMADATELGGGTPDSDELVNAMVASAAARQGQEW